MNIAETLRGLARRWYITVPGVILAVAVALGAWAFVPPSYERTATQLLLPGNGNIPADSNPLLYLGGLSFAADVLVRAVGSENNLNAIKDEYPGVDVQVARDDSSGGPFIIVTVDAPTDAEAADVVRIFANKTSSELADLQVSQKIPSKYQITVVSVAEDNRSVLQQRTRLVATFGGGVVVLAIALLIAGLVDGLLRRRRLAPHASPATQDGSDRATDRATSTRRARNIRRLADPLYESVADPDFSVPRRKS